MTVLSCSTLTWSLDAIEWTAPSGNSALRRGHPVNTLRLRLPLREYELTHAKPLINVYSWTILPPWSVTFLLSLPTVNHKRGGEGWRSVNERIDLAGVGPFFQRDLVVMMVSVHVNLNGSNSSTYNDARHLG